MVHLIGIPALIVAGGILYRLFFVKAATAVTQEVATVETAVKDEAKKI